MDRYQRDHHHTTIHEQGPIENGSGVSHRNPQKTNAYLVGGGIASLAAACFLIHDAHVPASQIHIIESGPLAGGSMDGSGDRDAGYIIRGGRMLNFTYRCLYDLLSTVPSLSDPNVTVMDEIRIFNAVKENKTHANARILTRQAEYPDVRPGVADVRDFELSAKDKKELIRMTAESEHTLGTKKINDFFEGSFFQTNFWLMWATMFAFQPWHSAVEFRRYLHRFIHELPRINTLEGVDRTPYNQYDSIILPITTYLEKQGVNFKYDTKVTSLSYLKSEYMTVDEIHITEAGFTGIINVHDSDIVLVTLGSMTASSSKGTNTTAPPIPSIPSELDDGSWELWKRISQDSPHYGHPLNFCTRIPESSWESFTVTLKSPELFAEIEAFTHNAPGTGALTTFKDSNWLMSIVVPHQPHFLSQPLDIQVLWGYALYPAAVGNFVQKRMMDCSGREILDELMGHLHFPLHPATDTAITIPCNMPYITSQFLTRGPGDRPQVIPHNTTNLAFLGQFVEIPLDVVFTVEYSVRGAMMAVAGLMGLAKHPRSVYRGDHDPIILMKGLKVMFENGTHHRQGVPPSETVEPDWKLAGTDDPAMLGFYPVVA